MKHSVFAGLLSLAAASAAPRPLPAPPPMVDTSSFSTGTLEAVDIQCPLFPKGSVPPGETINGIRILRRFAMAPEAVSRLTAVLSNPHTYSTDGLACISCDFAFLVTTPQRKDLLLVGLPCRKIQSTYPPSSVGNYFLSNEGSQALYSIFLDAARASTKK
jgi:hypothetical protein